MIYDKIENLVQYEGFNANITKAIDFLKNNDLDNIAEGMYDIDGENVFLLVQEYESKSIEGKQHEAHDKYIDIQFVLKGRELMKYAARIGGEEVLKTYPVEKDIAKYAPKTTEQDLIVEEGYFALFSTQDLHMPCLQIKEGKPEYVKKLVFKLKI